MSASKWLWKKNVLKEIKIGPSFIPNDNKKKTIQKIY